MTNPLQTKYYFGLFITYSFGLYLGLYKEFSLVENIMYGGLTLAVLSLGFILDFIEDRTLYCNVVTLLVFTFVTLITVFVGPFSVMLMFVLNVIISFCWGYYALRMKRFF